MDIITYALCKKLAKSAVSGIKNIQINGTNLIIETNDGQQFTMVFPTPADGVDGKDGISITKVAIDKNNHLICTLSDGSTIDAGELPGASTTAGGLIQVDKFENLPYPGEAGAIYLVLDTETIYYYDEANKLYKPVITNGVKDEDLTSVETNTDTLEFDNITTTFNLPVDNTKMNVYVNGVYQTEGIDYTIDRNSTPNKITFTNVYNDYDKCIITWVEGKIKVDKINFATDADINKLFEEEETENDDTDNL